MSAGDIRAKSWLMSFILFYFLPIFQMRRDIRKYVFHLCWSPESVPADVVSNSNSYAGPKTNGTISQHGICPDL